MTPISKELSEQIEREARLYAKSHGHKEIGFSSLAYEAGAAAYAHYKERCDALERYKREAVILLAPLLHYASTKEANIPLGKISTYVILQRAKQFEQAKKALEDIQKYCEGSGVKNVAIDNPAHMAIYRSLHTAKTAIASWKEEGKEVGNG